MKKVSVWLLLSSVLLSTSVQAQPIFECSSLLERALNKTADAYMWIAYDANFPIWRATLRPQTYNRLALRANTWARVKDTPPADQASATASAQAFSSEEIAEIEQTIEQMKKEKPTLRARLLESLAGLFETGTRITPVAQSYSSQPQDSKVRLARDLKLFSANGSLMNLGAGMIVELDSTGLVVNARHEREAEIEMAIRDFIERGYPGRVVTNVKLRIPEAPTRNQTYVAEASLFLPIGYRIQLFEVVVLPDGTISVVEKTNAPRFIYPTT